MKKLPYATQWIEKDDILAVNKALRSEYLTQGPRIERFEESVAKYCGAKYAVAVNSGTSALHLACLAAGIKAGDEVITSPITFVASANCILYCGGHPVFADVHSDTINIDPEDLREKINHRTKAIIPVHFAGHPCDMEEIADIAKKNKLIVIEDAAHALGAVYRGNRVGSCKYSDMTVLSFHAVKHITTGEGGMILTNRKQMYEKMKMLRSHGIVRAPKYLRGQEVWSYAMLELGYNYRVTDFQCALGMNQLNKLDRFIRLRRNIAFQYNKALGDCGYLRISAERPYVRSAFHLFVGRISFDKIGMSRKEIFEQYKQRGITTNVHYAPVYYQPYYRRLGYQKGCCPNAEKYYEEAITLPLYPKMHKSDLGHVIKATREIFKGVN